MVKISIEDVEEIVKDKKLIASFATSVGGQPHVAPVWYSYEGGVIQVATSGRKAKNARENPKVALSIEENEDGIPEDMVTIQGTAEVREDVETVKRVSKKIYSKYLGDDVDEWDEFFRKQTEDPYPGSVIIEVEIELAVTQG